MTGLRVLIVDDEPELVSALVERLEYRDIAATGVRTGREALELLGKERFDVIVADVRMPGLSGIELTRAARRIMPRVGVVLMAGQGSEEDVAAGRAAGASAYLMKPVDLPVLVKAIEAASKAAP